MRDKILLVLIVALVLSFSGLAFAGLQAGYISNRALLLDGSNAMEADLDMGHNYLIETDLCHWIRFSMGKAAVDVTVNFVPAGVLMKDRYYHRLTFAVDKAPGGEQTCSVSLSDGTNTMTVILTGDETSGYTTTNAFAWDVSTESLTLSYSQGAAGNAEKGFITIKYHYKENE